jgi:rubrerythrin
MAKRFKDLTEREVLALAITLEEEDGRIYGDFADALRKDYPASASLFEAMQKEEGEHRRKLATLYREKFGEHIPLIRRGDVRGFVSRPAVWLYRPLSVETIRRQAATMEAETRRFYITSAAHCSDLSIRQLLTDLAEAEQSHVTTAETFEREKIPEDVKSQEADAQRRLFVLQIVQPGLAGLMDGSVSTLAPLFAAAFLAHHQATVNAIPYDHLVPFKIGLATSVGAGISMGFAEALSDDGQLTGRGRPLLRGIVCGLMTTIGGVGHTLPYLIPQFHAATIVAIIIVVLELAAISWIRYRYMQTPLVSASIQVIVGGALVLLAGLLIGVS